MKRRKTYDNPWSLTPTECAVMDAVCRYGCGKLAAVALGKTENALFKRTHVIGKKMGHQSTLLIKALMWDRFRRNAGDKGPRSGPA